MQAGSYMNFLRFLFSKIFWKNIGIMLFTTVVLIWGVLFILKIYTHHGESITVPDLKGFSLEDAEQQLQRLDLRYQVWDSSYNADLPPKAVIDQRPKANEKVKEKRRIYLTLNAENPPEVPLPDIIDASLRNAIIQLESKGLKVGKKEYVPDLAKNAILDIKVNGVSVNTGKKVPKGTKVDLVLGDGLSVGRIPIPNLIEMTFLEAKIALKGYELNLGSVVKEGEIEDLDSAIVYSQQPPAATDGSRTINLGEPVDLFIRAKKAYQEKQTTDTSTTQSSIDNKN